MYSYEFMRRMIADLEEEMEEQRIYEWLRKELAWVEEKLERQDDKSEFDWRLTKIARELYAEGVRR